MIRLATHKDVPTCVSISRACGDFLRANGIDQWTPDYPNESILIQDVNAQSLYILEVESTIVGMVVINEIQDPEYLQLNWKTSSSSKNLVVHRLAVSPDAQGKGFAQQLMSFVEGLAKEKYYDSIRLDTFSRNKRNQQFYQQRGYELIGEVYLSYRTDFPYVCYEFVLNT